MKAHLYIRADGGGKIGLGHIIRCISIFQALKLYVPILDITFISKPDIYLEKMFRSEDIPFIFLPEVTDEFSFIKSLDHPQEKSILFFDTPYSYSYETISALKQYFGIIFFNNLSKGALCADTVIVPTGHSSNEQLKHFEHHPDFYYGLDYVVLNSAVNKLIKEHGEFRVVNRSIAITTGGSDPAGVLLKLLDCIASDELADIRFDLYPGENFMYQAEIKRWFMTNSYNHIFLHKYDLREICRSEIVLSTFGVSTYEFLALGKPIISVGHSLFNAEASRILEERYHCLVDMGLAEQLTESILVKTIRSIDRNTIDKLSDTGKRLVDGKGVYRVSNIILKIMRNAEL